MKQLLQFVRSGDTAIIDVPSSQLSTKNVLVAVSCSIVSAGTERMVVDFAEKNLIDKARSRPDLVRQTLDKAAREGVLATYEAVNNRLEQPMALGYSCAGTVLAVGDGVEGFAVGDRVACAGGGYAVHAEVVSVPKNLVVKLPDNVDFETGAFTTLAAIALQGIRLADPKLGEVVAVIGLGLLGQLTVQMLKTAGCIVVGMDIQPERATLSRQFGIDAATTSSEELNTLCHRLSNGHGADAVLITADTKSNQPVEVAGAISRRKGHVVAVGAVGMTIPRKLYYEKEVAFSISSSYGPGRYDTIYEEKGHDYPYAYVRWTENRNMQAFVNMAARDQVDVKPLVTHRYPIEQAATAYDLITGKLEEPFLGVLLTYPEQPDLSQTIRLRQLPVVSSVPQTTGNGRALASVRLGLIGAGNYANATLLPAIKDINQIERVAIASGSGLSARSTADRFDFATCTTDSDALLSDPRIDTVAILTRHHLHASQVIAALEHGKHVFVEKPLCLSIDELEAIVEAYRRSSENQVAAPRLMVGYNRRFAPFMQELRRAVDTVHEPLAIHIRANAGFIPSDHWTQDVQQGGGRLLGEGCHFIDLALFLADSAPVQIETHTLPNGGRYVDDNFVVTIQFESGSMATVSYLANGDKGFGKELIELFGGGLAARLDDYRTLTIRHGKTRINRTARLRQEKGHKATWERWVAYLTGDGPAPMTFDEIVLSTQLTLAARLSQQHREPIALVDPAAA